MSRSALQCAMIVIAMTAAVAVAPVRAQETVEIPGSAVFPESITADAAGNLYGGSIAGGGVWRVKVGQAKAEEWIKPGTFETRSTFGVLVDEKAHLLWVCSNDVSFLGIAGPGSATGSHLKGFDLTSGERKVTASLPGSPALCNDLAVAADGTIYVTNSLAPQILRLKPGAGQFDVWAEDQQFAPPPQGPGLDGIAIGGDGNLYVNTYIKGELFRVEAKNGLATGVTKLETSRPLAFADGLRLLKGTTFLMAEGGGTVDRVTVSANKAQIDTLKDGLASPTGVALSGGRIWVTEGQLPHLFDAAKNGPPKLPFQITSVPFAD